LSQVLALKYRPKKFEDLIGQESISNTLSLALDKDRLSNAYLFSGLRGSGKTSTARIFSKALLCDNGPTSKPCDICQNCVMANSNSHIDIIEMDAASHRGIDDIKDIIEHTKYKPNIGRFKVFIFDEVHMLTPQAFNALLKTLEEPPDFVKFILATTDPLKLPATILSRTQHFRFKSIVQDSIIKHLEYILNKENIHYENNALEIISRNGNGSLRDTLTILDQAIIYSKQNITIASVTDMLGVVDPVFLDNIFETIFNKDVVKLKLLCEELLNYSADTVIDEIIIYLKDKLFNNDIKYSVVIIDRFFRILNDAKYLLNINANSMFVLTLTFFKMIEAIKIKDIDEAIKEYENVVQGSFDNKQNIDNYIEIEKESIEPKIIVKTSEDKFSDLVKLIYDRNRQMGDCFVNSIKLISFENAVLSWESSAQGDCKESLRKNYSTIKELIDDVFGSNTKIKVIKKSLESEPKIENSPVYTEPLQQEDIEVLEAKTMSIDEQLSYDLENDSFLKSTKDLINPTKISLIKSKT
jgi:DNA polymerase-3 subunit gamma/tau